MSKIVHINEPEMIKLYTSGWSTLQLGNKYNCSHKTICARLRKYHIPIKNTSYYKGNKSANWKGCGDISSVYWWNVQKKAKQRNLIVELSIQDAWNLFLKQNKRCALTGVLLDMTSRAQLYDHDNIASLDRIDSLKGYTLNNVQWVHKKINLIKWNLSQDEFINWCNKVSNYQKKEI